jgi:DNA-binding LacI/PurR family transcriptional regulator
MSIIKIANHAGVSTATVSRVLNNFPGVRAETARQVREALEALNYVPSQLRRGRRYSTGLLNRSRRRTNSIAIITLGQGRDWLQLPVLAAAVAGISRGAKELGLRLLLDEVLDVAKPLPASITREVDGAIVFLSSVVEHAANRAGLESIGQSLPAVWVMGGGTSLSGVDHVSPDNHAIGHLAFEYLHQHNRRDVAFLTTLPSWPVMRVRGHAFAAAAHDSGARCSSYLLSRESRDGEIFGRRGVVEAELDALVDRLAAARPRPTGLFVSTDATTVQLYPLLRHRGLRPGEDLLIVSCDNEQIRLSGLSPRPASIDIGSEEAGWRAVHRLANRLEHAQEPPVRINVAPRLVEPEVTSTRTTRS